MEGRCDINSSKWQRIQGRTDELMYITKPVDTEKVYEELRKVREEGIKSLAVVFAHSYTVDEHEKLVGKIAKEVGFEHVSLSHQVSKLQLHIFN